MISFKVSIVDQTLIERIVERAFDIYDSYRVPAKSLPNRLSLTMDITACHANGCPLNLREMLSGADFDFIHDIGGIRENINRKTGELDGCFLPRFAAPTKAA